MKLRNAIAVAAAAAGIAGGVLLSGGHADASAPVISKSSHVVYQTSARCTLSVTHTVTYRHWSTAHGTYIAYATPRVTDTRTASCR